MSLPFCSCFNFNIKIFSQFLCHIHLPSNKRLAGSRPAAGNLTLRPAGGRPAPSHLTVWPAGGRPATPRPAPISKVNYL